MHTRTRSVAVLLLREACTREQRGARSAGLRHSALQAAPPPFGPAADIVPTHVGSPTGDEIKWESWHEMTACRDISYQDSRQLMPLSVPARFSLTSIANFSMQISKSSVVNIVRLECG